MPATSAQPRSPDGAIRFVLDGEVRTVAGVDPQTTVLQYLREHAGRTGTKEGCAEGDCGACTVVLAEPDGGGLRYRAVNSCIQFLPVLDGRELITVESLRGPDGHLHPVQQALVECHASQCGFCTPGFVMSLFALYKSERAPTRRRIDDVLAGNLCRCTGYRPIIAAARRMYEIGDGLPREERHRINRPCPRPETGERGSAEGGDREIRERLQSIRREGTLAYAAPGFGGRTHRFFAPASLAELAALLREHEGACLLAGGTDVGLWVTKEHRDLDTVVHTGRVRELRRIAVAGDRLEIGAAVTLTDAFDAVTAQWPDLTELLRRFASPPIRNTATVAGNIANGSPIGDSMPALIAIGASVLLRRGDAIRELPLEDFYLGYRRTALAAGEFVERVRIPLADPARVVRAYKVSKRFDQDISAVLGAFCITLDGAYVREARICFGGMAATPKRAAACERALTGAAWNDASVDAALAALDSDFAPISDMRASGGYRRRVARNLLRRFHLESTQPAAPFRVTEYAGRYAAEYAGDPAEFGP